MAGIYLHIPFCKQACHYCDFHFSTKLDLKGAMVDAIIREIEMQKDYLGEDYVETIYYGGGTPSLLTGDELRRIYKAIQDTFLVNLLGEFTLEANPDDLTVEKLRELKSAYIDRLSIGIQSFDDDVLKFFNRAHNASDSEQCMINARAVGFDNISIDLIYGIPNQSDEDWKRMIDRALSFKPEHISAYALTIEDKTVFGRWKASNKLKPVDEDVAAVQFEILMERLTQKGYVHYEISNFCLPGYESKHNSNYWNRVPYLGLGPSAHSYNGNSRQFNVSNNPEYIRKITAGELPFEREELSVTDKINEYFFIGLRTSAGCDISFLKKEFGYTMSPENQKYIDTLVELGKATVEDGVIKLTNKGKLLADKIASDLFVSNE